MKPFFIDVEGGDGSGKTSCLDTLKSILGDTAVFTREPGGTPLAEAIRELALKNPLAAEAPPEAMLCMMFAARYTHVVNTILPALSKGKHVITDRFDLSSYAYNVYAESGGKLESLFWDLRSHLSVVPDLYVFFDVDPNEGRRRAGNRNEKSSAKEKYDRFDGQKLEFHTRVREGYLSFLKRKRYFVLPNVPYVIIDANKPLDEVKKAFVLAVMDRLV